MRSLPSVLALACTSGLVLLCQLHAQPRPPGPGAPEAPDGTGRVNPRLFQLQMCSRVARQGADIYVATAAATPRQGQAIERTLCRFTGTGTLTATYDTASKKLSWKGSYSGRRGTEPVHEK
jgi:hypothetical protein